MSEPSLPAAELLVEQARWLAPARARLFRRVQIALRRQVLDLACGRGAVTGELVQRCGGRVLAVDRSRPALQGDAARFAGAARVCADAARLPFPNDTFDLVFCQMSLLWLDVEPVAAEIHRVLQPACPLVAIEPDYGGLIEHPPHIAARELWLKGLVRAGADPRVGRRLPEALEAAGFAVHTDLLDQLSPPSATRFALLRELPLTVAERQLLDEIERADAQLEPSARVAHLPLFLVTATKLSYSSRSA